MAPSRRELILGASAAITALGAGRAFAQSENPAAATAAAPPPAGAIAPGPRHGLSIFGDLKYPADFPHLDYVNPDAPRGGTLAYTPGQWAFNQNPNTFNTLNTLVRQGDAPPGMTIIYTSLMERAEDEPDAVYGLLADSVSVEDEGRVYRYRLRPEAVFHDGSPITAEDVAFSINTLKEKGHPQITQQMGQVEGAEAAGRHEAVIRFTGRQARDIPLLVATLPILSKAFHADRDFSAANMDVPLGSGPYRVGPLAVGRYIEFERVEDWWGDKLAINRGRFNFAKIRVEFFRDRQIAFEGFKGGACNWREEFTSRFWATGYDFPAMRDGRVVRFDLPDDRPSGAQGWWINTRRAQFRDPRVREALILAFDFEWTNANLMYGSYRRTGSVFENSDMKANGAPSPAEIALLEPFRDQLSPQVFAEPFSPPVSDGTGQDRALLRRAAGLLREAGWSVRDGALRNGAGEPFRLEILDNDATFEPHALAYIKNLRILGIAATFRVVDPAQFQSRQNAFDFDLMPRRYSLSSTPGESMSLFFGSRAAAIEGSYNLSGITDPAIDALLERIVNAQTREDLTTACRAFDRVFRAGRYWVPHWHKPSHWLATWDIFGRPQTKPRYGLPHDSTWWIDRERAERAGIRI